MKKKSFVWIFWAIFNIVLFSNYSYCAVEVFSNYDTILKVNNDNTIEVNKSLSLKNVYDVGIVPGQIEFKIGKGLDGSVDNIEVQDLLAYDGFGNEIKTQLRSTKDYAVIILDVYYPLLPGFEYDFDLYYKLTYKPGGIFFKSLQIPLRESTIPIQNGEFRVILPDNFYFTYLDADGKNATLNDDGSVIWEIEDDLPKSVLFEYSYLPIRLDGIKGSYIFWIGINVVLLLVLIFEIRREIKKIKSKEDGN